MSRYTFRLPAEERTSRLFTCFDITDSSPDTWNECRPGLSWPFSTGCRFTPRARWSDCELDTGMSCISVATNPCRPTSGACEAISC